MLGACAVGDGVRIDSIRRAACLSAMVASEVGGARWAVKAQIHSGARGKAGGIKLCSSEDEVRTAAKALLGKRLVTHQTGAEGRVVHRLYIASTSVIDFHVNKRVARRVQPDIELELLEALALAHAALSTRGGAMEAGKAWIAMSKAGIGRMPDGRVAPIGIAVGFKQDRQD